MKFAITLLVLLVVTITSVFCRGTPLVSDAAKSVDTENQESGFVSVAENSADAGNVGEENKDFGCGGNYPDLYACWFNDWQKRDRESQSRGWYYRCSFSNLFGCCYCCALSSAHNPRC